jgi:hypothetical protein
MEKNVLQSISGVAIYPIISFVIFFLFFLGLAGYVLVANRQHIDTMSQLPLHDDPNLFDEALKNHLNHDVIC